MMRYWIRRYGVFWVTLGTTLAAVLLSVLITAAANFMMGYGFPTFGLVVAVLAPTLIAPIFSVMVFSLLAQLDETELRLNILSTIDELTGVYNRRHFLNLAALELEHVQQQGGCFSIALMDMDDLKKINDRFGHLVGDQALREVSRICRETIRETDIFARYGGDEFVFLFPETGDPEARVFLTRICNRVEGLTFESEGRMIDPRISIGMHTYGPKSTTLDAILERADLALYKAKQRGGNNLV